MPLLNFQHQVGGLLMGPGTVYRLENVDGFGLGEKRERKYPVAGTGSTRWGREWRDGPTITFEGAVHTPGNPEACGAAMEAMLDAWQAAVDQSQPKLKANWTWKLPGMAERTNTGRPNICRIATNQIVLGRAVFVATFDVDGQLT